MSVSLVSTCLYTSPVFVSLQKPVVSDRGKRDILREIVNERLKSGFVDRRSLINFVIPYTESEIIPKYNSIESNYVTVIKTLCPSKGWPYNWIPILRFLMICDTLLRCLPHRHWPAPSSPPSWHRCAPSSSAAPAEPWHSCLCRSPSADQNLLGPGSKAICLCLYCFVPEKQVTQRGKAWETVIKTFCEEKKNKVNNSSYNTSVH